MIEFENEKVFKRYCKVEKMSDIVFKDCEYRYVEDGTLYCKNKQGTDLSCDNCTGNIHLNCDNYNAKKDLCLKWFETEVSKNYKDCSEKSVFNDKELSRKWSN